MEYTSPFKKAEKASCTSLRRDFIFLSNLGLYNVVLQAVVMWAIFWHRSWYIWFFLLHHLLRCATTAVHMTPTANCIKELIWWEIKSCYIFLDYFSTRLAKFLIYHRATKPIVLTQVQAGVEVKVWRKFGERTIRGGLISTATAYITVSVYWFKAYFPTRNWRQNHVS